MQLKATCLPMHTVTHSVKNELSVESGRAEPMEAVGMDAELGRLQAVLRLDPCGWQGLPAGQRCARVIKAFDLRATVLADGLQSRGGK